MEIQAEVVRGRRMTIDQDDRAEATGGSLLVQAFKHGGGRSDAQQVQVTRTIAHPLCKGRRDKVAMTDKVYIDEDAGTIAWPGGLDVAPDRLYADVKRVSASRS